MPRWNERSRLVIRSDRSPLGPHYTVAVALGSPSRTGGPVEEALTVVEAPGLSSQHELVRRLGAGAHRYRLTRRLAGDLARVRPGSAHADLHDVVLEDQVERPI